MARFFEQFVAFGTDSVGLERLMRFIQSIFAILTFYPTLIPMFLSQQPLSVHKTTELAMFELSSHLNLTRRAIRLFWCLGSFQSSWTAYGAPAKSIEIWLSIMADSFFALFGLMESVTLPDLLHTNHFSIFGYDEAVKIDGQSQGLWLAALSCAILSSGIKIFRAFAYRAVPESGSAFGASGQDEKDGAAGDKTSKAAVEKRKKEREALARENSRKIRALTRKFAAEVLDIVIPAWSSGLASIELGTVAIAMFLSTLLTGFAVWERCGMEIDGKRG
ncbi:hypothetical protein QQS21_000905 [Conoideocrella luteorostrata]|uniref:AoPex11B-like protein n=1 Tax=Conoideocrella luteorostrata TaxID=1105319 RepID=A0AAJ0G3P4_9HYPO|nr:hypothetical protein QQS21_000905 [Conoideocrella luteorostrata]